MAGDDPVEGVRPAVLLSWYRCRDLHEVDPHLVAAPEARVDTEHALRLDVLFAELGGAAGAASRAGLHDAMVTLSDGAGRMLATWGPRGCLRRGAETNLAPGAAWSECCSGTNGTGTALAHRGIVPVRGPEHWCRGFEHWNGVGVAVRDPVSRAPLAALGVSRWDDELPGCAAGWLRSTAARFENGLREQAVRGGRRLAEAFARAGRTTGRPVMAVDVAGRVVAANEVAGPLLGAACVHPAIDPDTRVTTGIPDLPGFVATAVCRARHDADWRGCAQLAVPALAEPLTVELRPVLISREPVGVLVVGSENPAGEALGEPPRTGCYPPRIPAVRGTRIVLLAPHEIRYAEADRHAVWFVTDQGRLRAATRGIDNVERRLNPAIFLRVHRRHIVNVTRVREIEPGFKGSLILTTSGEYEGIVVSRRHAAEVKRALGL